MVTLLSLAALLAASRLSVVLHRQLLPHPSVAVAWCLSWLLQVQSVAQLGVQLLLFTLGLEFSLTKLRAVRNVALLGGLLQTALFAVLAGVGAMLIGTSAAQVSLSEAAR